MKELTTSAEHWRRCIFLDFWRLIAAVWSLPRNPQYSDCQLLDPVVQNLPNILKCSFLFQNPKVRWRSPIYLLVWLQKQWKVITGELVTVKLVVTHFIHSDEHFAEPAAILWLQLHLYIFNCCFFGFGGRKVSSNHFPTNPHISLAEFLKVAFPKERSPEEMHKNVEMQPHPDPAPASFCPLCTSDCVSSDLCTSDLCQWLYQQWFVQQWLPQKPIEGFTSFPQRLFFSSKLKALFVLNYLQWGSLNGLLT